MPMPEFQVQHAHEFEGALIYRWKGGDSIPVIVKIPTRTFEDIFGRPHISDADRRGLTRRQCTLLAETNLEKLSRVIPKVQAEAAGQDPRSQELTAADIERSGEKMSDSILDTAARSGWVGRDGAVSQ